MGCVFSTGLVLGNEFCPLSKLSGGEEWLRAMGKQLRGDIIIWCLRRKSPWNTYGTDRLAMGINRCNKGAMVEEASSTNGQ